MVRPKLPMGTKIHIVQKDEVALDESGPYSINEALDAEWNGEVFLGCRDEGERFQWSLKHLRRISARAAGKQPKQEYVRKGSYSVFQDHQTLNLDPVPRGLCDVTCMFEQLECEYDFG